ncbi:MAG: hypothetical protein ABRQ39_24505 [Candidatus Eremiobacterota bacterium]
MEIRSLNTSVDIKKSPLTEKKSQSDNLTPQDTVALSSGAGEPSLIRKGIEGIGGVVGGIKGAATGILPASIEGGLGAASGGHNADGFAYGIGTVVQGGLAGAGLAVLLGAGGLGIAGLSAAGLVLGGVKVGLMAAEDTIDHEMGKNIAEHAKKSVADYKPSGDKIQDVTSNFVAGLPAGMKAGAESGWKIGQEEGKGTVSGLLEGTKGIGSVIAGTYEPPKTEEKKEEVNLTTGQKIDNAIKKTAEVLVGVPSGLVASALFLPVGPVQGFFNGVDLNQDYSGKDFDKNKAVNHLTRHSYRNASITNSVVFLETAGLGAGVGYLAMGGTTGALIGAAGGVVLGGLAYLAGKHRTERFHEGVARSVVHAHSDNAKTDSKAYDLRRDVTEGVLTGLAAGPREGFKEGYDVSKVVVDGAYEVTKDVAEAVAKGAVKVAKKVVHAVGEVGHFAGGMAKGTFEGIVKDKVE